MRQVARSCSERTAKVGWASPGSPTQTLSDTYAAGTTCTLISFTPGVGHFAVGQPVTIRLSNGFVEADFDRTATPEPGSAAFLLLGLPILAARRRHRRS